MNLLSLFNKRKPPVPDAQFDPVKPDAPFCAIGDVHGRIDLLTALVDALPENRTIICVGDLIDRGDQSAEVLRYVMEHDRITPLMGNHEQMMINFLQSPDTEGRRWLRNGGLQTLASFGIAGVTETSGGEALTHARDDLFEAMGDSMVSWLAGLESFAWSGNIAVVHAGADPNIPLEQHDPETFIWGHPEFRRKPRTDGFWIVHGHTIVDRPKMHDGRISIDTGAYATGQLTAAVFTPDGVEFVST
jgi:serine/threonine protein phosphatase 1